MNYGQLRTNIRAFVKEPSEEFFTEIDDWINNASFEITKEIGYPWIWYEQAATIGTASYAVPDGSEEGEYLFIRLQPLFSPVYNNIPIEHISVEGLNEYDQSWRSASNKTPTHMYMEEVDKLSLYPPPASALTFKYAYIYKEDDMTEDAHTTKVSVLFPKPIIYRAVAECRIKEEDDEQEIMKWMSWYWGELKTAKKQIFKQIKGKSGRTIMER